MHPVRTTEARFRWRRLTLAVCAVTAAAALTWAAWFWTHPQASLKTASGNGWTAAYPSAWTEERPPEGPAGMVLLARAPRPVGGFDPGLLMTRSVKDPNSASQDAPAVLAADEMTYSGYRAIRQGRVPVRGAKDAWLAVGTAQVTGQEMRVLDIVAVTTGGTAYHLQAVGPPTVLDDAVVDAVAASMSVS